MFVYALSLQLNAVCPLCLNDGRAQEELVFGGKLTSSLNLQVHTYAYFWYFIA